MHQIQLIVGLGNPGNQYQSTRHNVGFQFIDLICKQYGVALRYEKRFKGNCGRLRYSGETVHLLCPTTYMNLSGQAVLAYSHFHRLGVDKILVIHDDLDLPAGAVRLKQGGGHGGHNGLRDIITQLASREFSRLRIGIGHPGERDRVVGHVLKPADTKEQAAITQALELSVKELEVILTGDFSTAMNRLHGTGKLQQAD